MVYIDIKGMEDGAMPYGRGNTGLLKEPAPSSPSHLTVIVAVHFEIMLFFVFLIKLQCSLEAI